jgi:hypothetical protein
MQQGEFTKEEAAKTLAALKTLAMAIGGIGAGFMFGAALGLLAKHGTMYAMPIAGAALIGFAIILLLRVQVH